MTSGHSERYGPDAADVVDPDAPPVERRAVQQRTSIARQILSRSLLLATVPVLILGLVSIAGLLVLSRSAERHLESTRLQLTTETAGQGRAEQAQSAADATSTFVAERVDDIVDWTRAEPVTNAATAARTAAEPLIGMSEEEIRQSRGPNLQLDPGPARDYLRSQIVGQPLYSEVLFTDVNGFTVASTGAPELFIHAEEAWWQEAWTSGAYVSPMTMSPADGQLQFEVALRIDDRTSGASLGVMRAVVGAGTVQTVADDLAARGNGVRMQVFSSDGSLLVDTETADVPVGSSFFVDEVTRSALDQLDAGEEQSGFVVVGDTVAGYARSDGIIPASQLAYEVRTPQWVAVARQPMSTALAPLAGVDQIGADLDSSVWLQAALVLGVIILTLLLAWAGARRLASRIARPIRNLRDEAIRVADYDLPHMVSSLAAGYELHEIEPSEPIQVNADGELGDLAEALSTLQTTATELAATQTIGRHRDVASVLLNLGRRNQQLIGRQLRYIDQLERNESDPDTLKNLFLLDQMATRMRRNAESLLVLAGEDPPRRGTQPRPPEEVLRAAISEVEDYARVAIASAEPASIRPHVVSDLTHLLAELIENATNFSAPETMIHVSGEREPDGSYVITVIDRGIGMSPDRLAQANERISDPIFATDASSSFLGLYVVGRLAARHDIAVRLIESGSAGIAAVVTLPPDCLVEASDDGMGGGYDRHITAPNPVVGGTHTFRPPSVLPPSERPAYQPPRIDPGPATAPTPVIEPAAGPSPLAGPEPTPVAGRTGFPLDDSDDVDDEPDLVARRRGGAAPTQLPPGGLPSTPTEPPMDQPSAADPTPSPAHGAPHSNWLPRPAADTTPPPADTTLDLRTGVGEHRAGGNGAGHHDGRSEIHRPGPRRDDDRSDSYRAGTRRDDTDRNEAGSSDDDRVASELAGLLPPRTELSARTTEDRLNDLASLRDQSRPEPDGDDTDGVPIPPFRARQSVRPDDDTSSPATFQVKRRVPGRALAQAGQSPGPGNAGQADRPQLDADGNLPETSMNRAVEVRDKLTRFSIGVGAAKAERSDHRPSGSDNGGDPGTTPTADPDDRSPHGPAGDDGRGAGS